MRLSLFAAPVLVAGLVLGACSSKDPSAKDVREDLSVALQKGPDGLTEKQADCFAGLLVKELGVEAINDIDFTDSEPSAELAEAIASVAVTAGAACQIDD